MPEPAPDPTSPTSSPTSPVRAIPPDAKAAGPEEGIALCLSGGGYRAMLFHTGALWRLHETGILKTVKRVSSVSGGSIVSAHLGLVWSKLYSPGDSFKTVVVDPIRALAERTLDASSIVIGAMLPGYSSADRIISLYDKHLYHGKTLQDLPDHPRFVINATNVQTGALFRFSKPFIADWRVGMIQNPRTRIAEAVTASSAFPPVLSPCVLDFEPGSFKPSWGVDLNRRPYTKTVVLTDGGVYDNLGLETAYKRFRTVLVSDGGGKLEPEPEPKEDWARHSYRVLNIIDDQVRSLRKRQLITALKSHEREGTYWGIRTNIEDYKLPSPLTCPYHKTMELAQIPTRLKSMPDRLQEQLINWGYAVCDAALRKHVNPELCGAQFPYSGGV